ncbi:type II secretion system F family protein [Chloroflexota bacterium]
MARTVEASKKEKPISYRYEALNFQGDVVRGTIKATSEIAAERLIVDKGYNPTHVEVAPSMFSLEEALPTLFTVKLRDVILFSRQLATLLRSGISLLPSLEILQDQVTAGRAFKKIVEAVISDIRAGNSFSEAISKRSRAFNDIYCRTVSVGEQTGNLEEVLNRMADYMETQDILTKKVRRALTYPVMVMVVGLLVVVVLMTTVMPPLLEMFTTMNAELPVTTRILIAITEFLSAYQFYLLIALAVLAALIVWIVKQPRGRQLFDRLKLKIPLIGPAALLGELARFSRSMSVMVSAGMTLQETMEMMPRASNNVFIRESLNKVNEGLLLGEGLSEPMQRTGIFPPLLIQMVAVGEESNTLDYTMGVVADFYETSAEEKASGLVGMIGPISTVFMALLVGFIAVSIIMPMYTLTGAFG